MLKRHLASRLNLTSETFTRSIRRLITAGIIAEPDSHRLEIVSRGQLEKIASGET